MRNFKNFKDKDSNNFKRTKNITEIEVPVNAGRPYNENNVNDSSNLLFKKTISGLPRIGTSITVKEDPYSLVLPDSDPYALLNSANAKTGGKYGGRENLDSGLVRQIITSNDSTALNCFDSFLLRTRINYRYLPIASDDTSRGKGITREMINAIDEVLSIAKSTTYTNLAINNYYIKTDIPIDGDSDYDRELSCGTAEGLYALMTIYQIYLQSFASIFNYYNKYRANQGIMKKMSWDRETPKLNSLFTLMNKTSVVNQFKSLAYILSGEYFDVDWMHQFNMISSIVSRKSNSMTDPLLEITGTHVIPQFTLYLKAGDEAVEIISSDAIDQIIKSTSVTLANYTLQQVVDYISEELSINGTLYWARNPLQYAAITEQDKMNKVSNVISALINVSSTFKPAMADLRTLLDLFQRIGVNRWAKNTQLEVFNNLNANVTNNLTVNDIFKSLLSGSSTIEWNTVTHRWSTWTPWNYYYGIPEYDHYGGGCFITFSLKTIIGAAGSTADYLPIIFNGFVTTTGDRNSYAYAINRLGTSVELNITTFNNLINVSTARLSPLDSTSFTMRACYANATLSTMTNSYLQQACLKILDLYSKDSTVSATTDLAINHDLLYFIKVEIEDVINDMITYSRTNGPVVVNTKDKSEIGFLGL